MATDTEQDARPDERHSGAQKVFFLCFTEPVSMTPDGIRPHLEAHKAWILDLERTGRLVMGGPMLDDDYRFAGPGLLVLRARSFAEAQAIADADPFHARGIRKYRLMPWQVNEGSIELRLTLSNGRTALS
jgi:hypothetical protein